MHRLDVEVEVEVEVAVKNGWCRCGS